MRTVVSASGKVENITVRRTESADAMEINGLMSPATVAVFGRVNVIYLLEMANLAVTLTNTKNEILAHAIFLDHPDASFVDQACWEPWLREHFSAENCTPLNTLFMHLFGAETSFSVGSAKEIVRTAFAAITELHFILLVTANGACLEPALVEIFEPVKRLRGPGCQCAAFVCHRHNYVPRLNVRRARVADSDDLTPILAGQTKALTASYGPYFLAQLIEAQDEDNHAVVCESEGVAVGLMNVSGDVNVSLLNDCFQLGPYDGLCKAAPEKSRPSREPDPEQEPCGAEPRTPDVGVSQGAPNAFCIQLFFVDKKYEMRSVDFLSYVFKLFPARDFCIILVPTLTPEFPLLKAFLRTVPHPSSTLSQELYLCHRSSLLRTFDVRVAVSNDQSAVESLVGKLHLHQSILEDLTMFYQARGDPDGTPLQAFVAQVQGQVVGILIIRNEEDVDYIRAHYNVEDFVYFAHHHPEEHGQLCHFILNPVFQHYARHFLKEALRLGHKSCLYYPIYPSYRSERNASAHSLTWVLNCMVPVRPRRQIIYPLEELGVNGPSRQVSAEQVPYALNHFNRKLTMEPKFTVNARIVVVGASVTGISFLEVLAFCPHLKFNNLTLISTHGFPGCYTNENMRFLATSHSYSDREHSQLSLRSWVNVVEGKMTAIDRAAKHVTLSGGQSVPYDHLILCTGQQYQVPCPTNVDISQPITNSELTVPPNQRYMGPLPSNLFTLNDPHDCVTAYHWLLRNFVNQEGSAVVYGNTIDTYTCVETLLCLGVGGSRIHLVHLPVESPLPCFSDPEVERAVAEALGKKGVHVHHSCLLARINEGRDPEPITSVSFTTEGEPFELQCSVFLNFSRKGVDYEAFKTINGACLVYDGGLVIDAAFHTNDPAIRAAGPLTKFARRYHANHCTHAQFCSREVGRDLAARLLPFFDPTLEHVPTPPADQDRLIPVYSQANIQGGRLPGGYSYLQATKPAIYTASRAHVSSEHSRVLVTGRPETGDYFRLQLNQHCVVQSLTCLSLKPIPVSNYLCLYGRHELLLNRLCQRFQEGLVPDFYSYFKESWCMAIYHDRFGDFLEELRQIMQSTTVQGDGELLSIPELAQRAAEEKLLVPGDLNLYLRRVLEESSGLASLKRRTLSYLQYNRYHLTMLAQPGFM